MSVRRRTLIAALLAAPAAACSLPRSEPVPDRVRGTITKVVGSYVTVRMRSGRKVIVAVASDAPISRVLPAQFSDIKTGSYIGTAAMDQTNGTLRALEVQLFPEDLRGLGQGHHPWDLEPTSTMTNGTVAEISGANGRTLTVKYLGGSQTVVVPPDAPVVTYAPGSMADLVPGAHVVISVEAATDAMPRGKRVVVGADGMTPPM